MGRRNPWIGIGFDAWRMTFEAASVIGLRTLKIAAGGAAAEAEARRMIPEKIDAGLALQALALSGGLGLTAARSTAKALALYRRRVHANYRRLSGRD